MVSGEQKRHDGVARVFDHPSSFFRGVRIFFMVQTETCVAPCYSLGELARRLDAELKGDPGIRITGVGSLEDARPGDISFVVKPRHTSMLCGCKASALLTPPTLGDLGFPTLIVPNPYLAMARVAQMFDRPPELASGVHPAAILEEGVQLGEDTAVGALAHIGSASRIGARTRVYANVTIGRGVLIGEDCLLHPGVVIMDGCRLGDRVIAHSGAVIGADGYGFAQDEAGRHVKIPQKGIVQIDDDVEIGANTTIDRATFGRTWIQRGVKIDNLVMIAHNVVVGEHSLIVAQVGVAGSTKIGRHVILGGQAGISGQLELGDGVRVGAKSGVAQSVEAGRDVVGLPAMPNKDYVKIWVLLRRLPEMNRELKELRAAVAELQAALKDKTA